MSAGTLRSFVERVVERHGDGVEQAVPSPFDWKALCSDAPEMARRLQAGSEDAEGSGDDGDLAPELDLVDAAEQSFLRAYLGGLAGLALQSDDDRDPESVVEDLVRPLGDDEEQAFELLASERLAAVERALAGEPAAVEDDSAEGAAVTLTDAAWPSVEVALEGLTAFHPERETELPHAVRQVLTGVARIGAILAAFRWMVDAPAEGR